MFAANFELSLLAKQRLVETIRHFLIPLTLHTEGNSALLNKISANILVISKMSHVNISHRDWCHKEKAK